MSDAPTPPAGWFPDPEVAGGLRYWDGATWTEHRAPVGPQAPSAAAVVGAPLSPTMLRAAGALLIVAGLGRAVSYLAPYEAFAITIAFSVLEVIGWVGAFAAFWAAGFPSRGRAVRTITLVLAGLYLVSGIVGVSVTFNPYGPTILFAVLGLIGFAAFGVGIAFAVSSLRTPGLARRLAALPAALYAGLAVFGLAAGAANAATASAGAISSTAGLVIGGVSGAVPIAVGALVIAFGRTPHEPAS